MRENETIGIYVHFPFCRRRCSYCPFAISVDLRLETRYFACLAQEIGGTKRPHAAIDTVYFGGGTPSLSQRNHLMQVREALSGFGLDRVREWTLEANPEDVTDDAIAFWRELGVTRLSVGVQSLHETELRPLARIHGREGALAAANAAVRSGLRTSVDLIIGLPGQTPERFRDSMIPLLDLGVGHVSLYILDLDEDSPLRRRVDAKRVALPDEDAVVAQYETAIELCASRGLAQYEISNFARPGEESFHNLRYWDRRSYLGFGLAAHSFDGARRWANARAMAEYIDCIESGRDAVTFREELSVEEMREEALFLGMRQGRGMSETRLRELAPQAAEPWIVRGLSDGWLRRDGVCVAFTARGFLLSSELIAELF